MKDLFKPGRKLNEYIDNNGTPKKACISCLNRNSIKLCNLGRYLCKNDELHSECNPRFNEKHGFVLDHLLWEPRVNYNTLGTDEDWNV